MAEQRSANASSKSLGANAESSVSSEDTKRSESEPGITTQNMWRIFIVGLMVLVGGVVGYHAGDAVVRTYGSDDISDTAGGLLGSLHHVLGNPYYANADRALFPILGGLAAYLIGSAAFTRIVAIVENVKTLRSNEKVALFVGLLCGLVLTLMFGQLLTSIPQIGWWLTVLVGVTLIYICIAVTFSMKESFGRLAAAASPTAYEAGAPGEVTSSQIKILDTNVIIDGRVSDVCRSGFIEGTVYVPGFVLDELQHIADSSDSLKRARGRRGLDILNQMRSELSLMVRTLDAKAEATPHEEVDSKLVKLAKKLGGAIVTNDFNLNKVAELQGVPVLNINELANALKPVVLPGEEMRVAVIKEGKEMSQGIGYLDDGTMIVIEGARRRIGETLEVVVSSVLQTVAGKMIFAQIKTGHDEGYESDIGDGPQDSGQGARSYSGGRPRRPFRDH